MKNSLKKQFSLGILMACLITGNIGFAKDIQAGTLGNFGEIKENEDVTIKGQIGYNGKIELGENNKLTFVNPDDNSIYGGCGGTINVIADYVDITAGKNNGIFMSLDDKEKAGNVIFGSSDGRKIKEFQINAAGQGIDNKFGSVTIYGSDTSSIYIASQGYDGQENEDQAALNTGREKDGGTDGKTFIEGGTIVLTANGGSGIFTRTDGSSTNIKAYGSVTIASDNRSPETGGFKDIDNAGIKNMAGTTTVTSNNANIEIMSSQYGILAENGEVNVTSKTGNTIKAAIDVVDTSDPNKSKYYGSKHSVKAEGGSQVNLNATAGDNMLAGVIYAKDDGTVVNLNHSVTDAAGNVVSAGTGSNYIYSSAHGSTDTVGDRSHVVAALYAQNQGEINIIAGEGGINYIETSYTDLDDSKDSADSERTVWAQQGGIIQIKGTTTIKSSNAEDFYEDGYATNSRGIAITAGTGVDLDDKDHGYTDAEENKHAFYENGILADVDDVLGHRSSVNLEYGADSAIYGDIVSGYGGNINIKKYDADGVYGINIQGNALAANDGILNIDLGEGGTWYGRADDYQDAGYGEDAKNKQNYYNPVFSDTIYTGGTVNITMGEGSMWYLTGQSWVSSLDVTGGNGNVTIDMERFNEGTHGLTISELKGETGNGVDATFVMDLDHTSHSTSDMLYIKNGTGEYDVVLKNAIDGMENINEDNVLRFATVQGGAQFNSVTMDNVGLYNLGFEIDHSEYNTEATEENEGYNGSSVNENKPGNENVEGFFFDQNNNNEDSTRKIMLLDEIDTAADDPNSVQNWYITKVSGQEISDAGKTVVAMSKVNYSNAVYMDRLNKRLGEARYINSDEDQGVWVRLRHDRTGKSGEFRSMNTMYEIGYDEKQECDNGERRVGAAIDYMDGSAEYSNVAGTGDIKRRGIWLYDTWMGDKGHYADYVAKWGHLDNDFKLYRDGQKITGDYSNNVYSISAEYGRKKDIGNDWYFEPQAQLQYARVTGASYTTSQGTEVDLDAINSLIARAGFRLGKDLSERSTVYFKADVLHEFLGDQDIYAKDKTGSMDVTYGNEGTWCDVGFGFAAAMSKTSYAYLDFEKSFGNDNDETYQINAGMQWSF